MSVKEIVMIAKQKYDDLIKQEHSSSIKDVQSTYTQTETDMQEKREDDHKPVPSDFRHESMFVQHPAEDGIPGMLFTDHKPNKMLRRQKKRFKWLTY